jgi:hypothetical protein
MATRILVFFYFILTVGQACRPAGEDFAINTAPEFTVGIREALGPAPRSLELLFATRDTLPCRHAQLQYTLLRTNRMLDLKILGFYFPDPCYPALHPYQTAINSTWSDPASYHVQLGIGEFIRNSMVLTINEAMAQIYLAGKDGFELAWPSIHRLPEEARWGRIELMDTTGLEATQALLDSYIYTRPQLAEGHYGHFEILPGQITQLTQAPLHDIATYIFSFSCLWDGGSELADALQALSDALPGKIEVHLWSPQQQLL